MSDCECTVTKYNAGGCRYCHPQEYINKLESELSASQAREAELREKLEAAEADRAREVDFKNAELATLRDKKFAKFNNEDCWIFQDDGADELQSLVCPIVIKPARLIELLAAEARIKASQEQEPVAIVKRGVIEWLWCKQFDHGQLYAQPPIPHDLAVLQRENAELRKLLESKVPEGWQLVPKEPTEDMIDSGYSATEQLQSYAAAKMVYYAMLNAAPQPKEPKQ